MPTAHIRHQKLVEVVVDGNQLNSLRSKVTTLWEDGRFLLDRLRGSLLELRTQRDQLVESRTRLTLPPVSPAPPERPAPVRLDRDFGLTRREVEVALLLARGQSNARIAATLQISPHTARHHTQHVLAKLGVHSRGEAAARIRG